MSTAAVGLAQGHSEEAKAKMRAAWQKRKEVRHS
jgi:hypothetical protein